MLTALSKTLQSVPAWEAQKSDGPFICKKCRNEVILKKGKIRQHHFSHKVVSDCSFGRGESDIHYSTKRSIFEGLLREPLCSECELEKRVGDTIPDIFAVINKCKIAIEIQKSTLSLDDIIKRTQEHYKNHMNSLWIIPNIETINILDDPMNGKYCAVKQWQNFIYMLYFNNLFIWSGDGCHVQIVKFSQFTRYVHQSEYYDEYGSFCIGGGYNKRVKTKRSVTIIPDKLNIATDFIAKKRPLYKTKNFTIPPCGILEPRKNYKN